MADELTVNACIDCGNELDGNVAFGRCLPCRVATLPAALREALAGAELARLVVAKAAERPTLVSPVERFCGFGGGPPTTNEGGMR